MTAANTVRSGGRSRLTAAVEVYLLNDNRHRKLPFVIVRDDRRYTFNSSRSIAVEWKN